MSPTDPILIAALVGRILEGLGIRYVIGGSVAASLYGEPRTTLDVDLMIQADERQIVKLAEELQRDFYVEREAAVDAVRSSSSFNAIHMATSMRIDFFLAEREPFAEEQLARRRAIDVGGGQWAYFYMPEDLIIRKLLWFPLGGEQSERQWGDVLGVLTIMRGRLDLDSLHRSAKERGVADLLDRAIAGADQR